jgi:hypothetical protein
MAKIILGEDRNRVNDESYEENKRKTKIIFFFGLLNDLLKFFLLIIIFK